MNVQAAETMALQALAWLVGNDDLLPVFLGASGASLPDLAAGAGRADIQVAVLDFLLMDDAWVAGFCDAAGIAYSAPMQARMALAGGQDVHWT